MATQQSEPEYEGAQPAETHLWDCVHVLLRRRRLIVAVFVLVVAVAATRSLLTKPVYEATAQLLIEKQEPHVLNFQGVIYGHYYGTPTAASSGGHAARSATAARVNGGKVTSIGTTRARV